MERINKARLTSAMIGVPCNLADETWKNKLLSHGYDKDQKTFGSLLGISYYLEEAEAFDRAFPYMEKEKLPGQIF